MLALLAILSLLVGGSLGLLGGGGSILAVPMFAYVAGLEPQAAIAGSLLMVGATSLAGALVQLRRGKVRLVSGLVFGGGGMAGAWAGGSVARFFSGTTLLVGFGLLMLVSAAAMLRGPVRGRAASGLAWRKAVLVGAVVGVVAGLVGAGGGFLIVPALVLLGGLDMPEAAATSLLIIALQSLAGFAGHAGDVQLDVPLLLVTSLGGAAGTFAGVALGRRISAPNLRRAFAWLTLTVSLGVLVTELRQSVPLLVLVPVLLAAAAVAVAVGLRGAPRSPSLPQGATP